MTIYDALIVGGGPAGSSCARVLTRGGAKVGLIDRAAFPRVKLCAGWISAPIWDVLELAPGEYTAGLWPWTTAHVDFAGEHASVSCKGWFIRRFELDEFLLRRCGAELHLGVNAKAIERDDDGLWRIGDLRARHLIGAGGTHCPVARVVAPPRPRGPVGVQEHEFEADPDAIARTRIGGDGEPELLLHDDLRGYAWNVPKTGWLNVGVGTVDPTEVRAAWQRAREHFDPHVPDSARPALEHMKGHSYYLFDPAHLDGAAKVDERGAALLVGDSLGLAQPLTAEGILPATLSGRLAAEAILDGVPADYPRRMRTHPVLADYARVFRLRELAATAKRRKGNDTGNGTAEVARNGSSIRVPAVVRRFGKRAVARGFAWMFSGARLPAPRLIDLALAQAEKRAGGSVW